MYTCTGKIIHEWKGQAFFADIQSTDNYDVWIKVHWWRSVTWLILQLSESPFWVGSFFVNQSELIRLSTYMEVLGNASWIGLNESNVSNQLKQQQRTGVMAEQTVSADTG